jgi:uncharacterized protein
MAIFAVICTMSNDAQLVEEVRPLHREYLAKLDNDGKLRGAGPWVAGGGGLLIYDVADELELRMLIDGDPYKQRGVADYNDVHEWKVVRGTLSRS